MQKVPLMFSSSASLSMVCMVSRVIIMKGMLWDTAVGADRREVAFISAHSGFCGSSHTDREAFRAAWRRWMMCSRKVFLLLRPSPTPP